MGENKAFIVNTVVADEPSKYKRLDAAYLPVGSFVKGTTGSIYQVVNAGFKTFVNLATGDYVPSAIKGNVIEAGTNITITARM